MCPECKTGYFWSAEYRRCRPCNTSSSSDFEHCTNCPTEHRCIQCENHWFPTYLQDGCQQAIEDCDVPSHDLYRNDGVQFVCQTCSEGFFPEGGKCSRCQIPGCKQCLTATQCAVCIPPQRFDPTETYCVDPIEDCVSDPQDYQEWMMDPTVWMCPECREGLVWDDVKGECVWCDENIDPMCTACFQTEQGEANLCLECGDDMIPTYDQLECMPHIAGCDLSLGWEDSYFIKDNRYHCSKCLNDFVWDPIDEACKKCDDYIPGCQKCNKNAQKEAYCEVCIYDFEAHIFTMPSVDGLRCVNRIQNCQIPIYTQPGGLHVHPNGKDWVCPTCAKAYFRDEKVLAETLADGILPFGAFDTMCSPCLVENCEMCSEAMRCDKCYDFAYEEIPNNPLNDFGVPEIPQ